MMGLETGCWQLVWTPRARDCRASMPVRPGSCRSASNRLGSAATKFRLLSVNQPEPRRAVPIGGMRHVHTQGKPLYVGCSPLCPKCPRAHHSLLVSPAGSLLHPNRSSPPQRAQRPPPQARAIYAPQTTSAVSPGLSHTNFSTPHQASPHACPGPAERVLRLKFCLKTAQ